MICAMASKISAWLSKCCECMCVYSLGTLWSEDLTSFLRCVTVVSCVTSTYHLQNVLTSWILFKPTRLWQWSSLKRKHRTWCYSNVRREEAHFISFGFYQEITFSNLFFQSLFSFTFNFLFRVFVKFCFRVVSFFTNREKSDFEEY